MSPTSSKANCFTTHVLRMWSCWWFETSSNLTFLIYIFGVTDTSEKLHWNLCFCLCSLVILDRCIGLPTKYVSLQQWCYHSFQWTQIIYIHIYNLPPLGKTSYGVPPSRPFLPEIPVYAAFLVPTVLHLISMCSMICCCHAPLWVVSLTQFNTKHGPI